MSVHKRRDGKPGYYVRYRDPSGRPREAWGPGSGQAFTRRIDAERLDASLRTDVQRGQWRDPQAQRVTVAELADRWLETKRDRNTRTWNRSMLRHVNARWAHVPVGALDFLAIQSWVTELQDAGHGPDTVRGAFRVLHEIVKAAQRIRAIQFDPCDGVVLPKVARREMLFLTPAQVDLLALALDEAWPGAGWGVLVRLAAYSGCRAGEIGGLQVKHLEVLRHRVHVTRALKTYGEFGPTKTDKPRWVDLPRQLCDALAAHLSQRPHEPENPVWTGDRGAPLNHQWFYSHRFKPIVLELPGIHDQLRFHDYADLRVMPISRRSPCSVGATDLKLSA